MRFQAALFTTVFFLIHFFTFHILKSNYRPTNYHHPSHHPFLSSFIINNTPNTTKAMPVTTLSFIPPISGSLQGSFIMFTVNHLLFYKSFFGIFIINKAVIAIHTGIGISLTSYYAFLDFFIATAMALPVNCIRPIITTGGIHSTSFPLLIIVYQLLHPMSLQKTCETKKA